MKKIIVLTLALFGVYFVYTHLAVHKIFSGILQPNITINDLKDHPSLYADSLIVLKNLHVVETQSLLNYSRSKVSDETGHEIFLLSSRPFSNNETIAVVKGRYTILYIDNKRKYDVFISDDLKPFNDLIKLIKKSVI
jgi:hypothetical protein